MSSAPRCSQIMQQSGSGMSRWVIIEVGITFDGWKSRAVADMGAGRICGCPVFGDSQCLHAAAGQESGSSRPGRACADDEDVGFNSLQIASPLPVCLSRRVRFSRPASPPPAARPMPSARPRRSRADELISPTHAARRVSGSRAGVHRRAPAPASSARTPGRHGKASVCGVPAQSRPEPAPGRRLEAHAPGFPRGDGRGPVPHSPRPTTPPSPFPIRPSSRVHSQGRGARAASGRDGRRDRCQPRRAPFPKQVVDEATNRYRATER